MGLTQDNKGNIHENRYFSQTYLVRKQIKGFYLEIYDFKGEFRYFTQEYRVLHMKIGISHRN